MSAHTLEADSPKERRTTDINDANGNTISSWRTTNFGSAVHDPSSFLKIVLDSITFAAALFTDIQDHAVVLAAIDKGTLPSDGCEWLRLDVDPLR